jgi:hypothetical protein
VSLICACVRWDCFSTLNVSLQHRNDRVRWCSLDMVASGKSQHFWSENKILFMLNIIKEMDILKFLDGHKHRNGDVFNKVSAKMREGGFVRTVEQMSFCWKALKQGFFKARKRNNSSESNPVKCSLRCWGIAHCQQQRRVRHWLWGSNHWHPLFKGKEQADPNKLILL